MKVGRGGGVKDWGSELTKGVREEVVKELAQIDKRCRNIVL